MLTGVLKASTNIGSSAINNSGLNMVIGKAFSGLYTNAAYDDLYIYNRALTEEEIRALYLDKPELMVNNYLYNSASELNQAAQWYETDSRAYDPALGRMNGVDPVMLAFLNISLLFLSNILQMNCVDIIEYSAFQRLLAEHGKDSMRDFDYQMETNHAFIYKLKTGQLVLLPSFPTANGPMCLVFTDQACFNDCASRDHFPIDNYDKQLEDYDSDRLKDIKSNISYYWEFLNHRYKVDFTELSRKTIQHYYLEVLKDDSAYPSSIIALGALMGELMRVEVGGKWVVKKNYGPYNPYYSPLIRSEDKIFPVYERLYSMIKSKTKESSTFFDRRFFGYTPVKVFQQAGVKLTEL